MRRSSVITIILLILVIIGLSVTLVVTNLPKNQVEENINTEEQMKENETENVEEEKPNYISLDSQIVENMKSILDASEAFYLCKDGTTTEKNISDYDKQYIVYNVLNLKEKFGEPVDPQNWIGGTMPKSEMDTAIKQIFGDDATYNPCDFGNKLFPKIAEYNANEQQYYHMMGFGGGGPRPYALHGIINVAEYSDRYEVTEKYLYSVPSEATTTYSLGYKYDIYNWYPIVSEKLVEYKDFSENYGECKTIDEIASGVQIKDMYIGKKEMMSDYDSQLKLLSKFYDQATEYKHTFMKKGDGTYYWVKSEII